MLELWSRVSVDIIITPEELRGKLLARGSLFLTGADMSGVYKLLAGELSGQPRLQRI